MPRDSEEGLKFHLPDKYMDAWAKANHDGDQALDIKQRFFSRMYLFGAGFSNGIIPFRIVEIDQDWLTNLRER